MELIEDPALDAFRHAVLREDDEIDLAHAALTASLYEYPDLAVQSVLEHLDEMAGDVILHAGSDADILTQLRALLEVVIRRPRLRGAEQSDTENYYDPRNSFLNDVLERGVGIPIALAVLLISVGARAGVPLGGTAMPMHFLVRVLGVRTALFVDCYDGGHLLGEEACKETLRMMSQGRIQYHRSMIELVPNSAILTRYLTNLKLIYYDEERFIKAVCVLDRLVLLNPEMPELARERGLVHYRLGQRAAARRDLQRYLTLAGQPHDAVDIRNLLRKLE